MFAYTCRYLSCHLFHVTVHIVRSYLPTYVIRNFYQLLSCFILLPTYLDTNDVGGHIYRLVTISNYKNKGAHDTVIFDILFVINLIA